MSVSELTGVYFSEVVRHCGVQVLWTYVSLRSLYKPAYRLQQYVSHPPQDSETDK